MPTPSIKETISAHDEGEDLPRMGGRSVKHTPGPWRVCNHSWSDTSILADGFDHGVCLLDINHATEESQEADEALMAANARLIAAAPDLLAACKIAFDQTCSVGRRKDWEQLRAAIAKAEGRSV